MADIGIDVMTRCNVPCRQSGGHTAHTSSAPPRFPAACSQSAATPVGRADTLLQHHIATPRRPNRRRVNSHRISQPQYAARVPTPIMFFMDTVNYVDLTPPTTGKACWESAVLIGHPRVHFQPRQHRKPSNWSAWKGVNDFAPPSLPPPHWLCFFLDLETSRCVVL